MNFYGYVAQDAECKTPIDKCRANGVPSECRWHRYFSTYGIDAVDGLNIDELSKDKIRFIFKESSGETRSKTENAVRGVISDIEKLCPSCKMPEFNLICADTTVLSAPAISELDTQRTPEPFLCIGKFETSSNPGYSYFHEGEHGVEDVIRYEIGHILTTRHGKPTWNHTLSRTRTRR